MKSSKKLAVYTNVYFMIDWQEVKKSSCSHWQQLQIQSEIVIPHDNIICLCNASTIEIEKNERCPSENRHLQNMGTRMHKIQRCAKCKTENYTIL